MGTCLSLHQHMSTLVCPLVFNYCTTLVYHSCMPFCTHLLTNDGIAKDSLSSGAAVYQIGQKSIAKNPLWTDYHQIAPVLAGHLLSCKSANHFQIQASTSKKYLPLNLKEMFCCSTRYILSVRYV